MNNFIDISFDEMTEINGGKVTGKDVLKVGGGLIAIGAGIYEISTGIGAPKGAKDIVTGTCSVIGGLIIMFDD